MTSFFDSLLALKGCCVVLVRGGGEAVFDTRAGASVSVVKRLLSVFSGGSWGAGDRRLTFGAGSESGIRMAGSGYVGHVIEAGVAFVAASGFASGDEGCNDGCGQHES